MTEPAQGDTSQDDRSRGFIEFDYIPFEDIVWGQKLGSGSFGLVHRGKQSGSSLLLDDYCPSGKKGLAGRDHCLTARYGTCRNLSRYRHRDQRDPPFHGI